MDFICHILVLSLFLSISWTQIVVDTNLPNNEDYGVLYDKAMQYYYDKNYEQTKNYLELALADKRFRDKMLRKCESHCSSVPDLTLSKLVVKRNCIKKCMYDIFGEPIEPSYRVRRDFETRMTYSYLQYAYYKLNDLLEAYNAAITNLKHNTDDDMMQKNVKYYGRRINMEEIRLREPSTTYDFFSSGMKSYNEEDFRSSTVDFNKALKLYLTEVKDCKALCSVAYDDDNRDIPDITNSHDFFDQLAAIYTNVMECKYNCVEDFESLITSDNDEGYLLKLLNYLQFSAYQAGDLVLASQTAQSYLSIRQDDIMASNLKYYQNHVESFIQSLVDVDTFHKVHSEDLQVLTQLVGKREMNNRLREKLKVVLGDSRKVSELSNSSSFVWEA